MGAFTPQVVVPSAARTATGQSAALGIGGVAPSGQADTVALAVDVTAVSGTTPSMTVSVEWSFDGTSFFVADVADAFTAITAAKKVVRLFDVKASLYRVVWTISGTTPSFTFSVTELADKD